MKNIIFFGPPGAGKGTQANLLSKNLFIPHVSTGDILRSKINEKNHLAIKIKEIIANGELVSDDILNQIVSEKLLNDFENGFILDGYPRTLEQANYLNLYLMQNNLNLDFIFSIELDFNNLKQRILKRSKEEEREDDNIQVIETRFQYYNETTKKVSEFYKSENPNIFYEINGDQDIDKIQSKIMEIVKI